NQKQTNHKKKKAKQFAYWITLSTLDKGKTIDLPLNGNPFFDAQNGELKNFCQINVDEDQKISVCLLKEIKPKEEYQAKVERLALDLGLRTLFATNQGHLYGQNFIDTLKQYDSIITPLAQNRQRQGLPVKSPRYKHLVSQFRHCLKNEINRVLNRIVLKEAPKEIVVEKLDFSSPELSKTMNRLLSHFGKGIIREKLQSIQEVYKIKITSVCAAYTSLTCSKCGYIDKKNRRTQSLFYCQYCHRKLQADVNGARNVLLRSSQEDLGSIWLRRSEILKKLVIQFLKRNPRAHSCAPRLLDLNPYFKGFIPSGNNTYTQLSLHFGNN
ncbi:MAG: transposase, partial [Planctomycetota bacterium]